MHDLEQAASLSSSTKCAKDLISSLFGLQMNQDSSGEVCIQLRQK